MSEPVSVKQVSSKRELKNFILFPWKIYRGETRYPAWVPPLILDQKILFNTEKNPFYRHADQANFLAYRGNKIAGRISAIVDHQYIATRNDQSGYFGFFESVDDREVAGALFGTAEVWLGERGMKRMIGPMNPTPNHILGILMNDYDNPPVVQVPYNPPYYPELCESAGLRKEKDHYAYYLDQTIRPSERIKRVADIARKRGHITIRTANMKQYRQELDIIKEIYNNAWSENSDFVPLTDEEFYHMAEDLKLILIPELVFLAFVDGVPAGFCIPLPDINQILIKMNGRLLPFGLFKLLWGKRKVDLVRLALMGIRHEYRNKGIDAIFIYESYMRGERWGFKKAEMSLIIEDNYKLLNLLDTWGCKRYRTYRIYEKDL